MIVAEKPLNVTTSGVNSHTFGIALNRKMFRILSADLYSDKIRAVIRELSTNAADAHVAARNTDKPFDVHLPNMMEPWFEVKDYGTGLSKDQMYSVYTQYGVSDKTDSNEYTGCLGLGSKSPFAYTDSFTVESRQNGVKTVYTAYINENGFPALSDPLTEEKTDEPNGLTVKFPVKSTDFNSFRQRAVDTLKWFKVRPNVTGNSGFTYPERPDYLRQTDKYALNRDRHGTSHVVMGNVAYPIDANQVVGYYGAGEDERIRTLLHWGVELYINIGDVDITASREALSYDDDEDSNKRTVPTIKAACREAIKDLEAFVTKDIASKPTIWEARRALHDIRRSYNGLNFTAVWGGQTITDSVKVPAEKAFCETFKRNSWKGDRLIVKRDKADTIHADGATVFLNDGRGGVAGIRRYLEGKEQGHRVYVLNPEADAAWLKETGLDAVVVKTSTLPKPERASVSRGAAAKAKVYVYNPYGSGGTAAGYWTPAEIDLEDDNEFVFVEILYFNYRTKDGEETQHPNQLKTMVRLAESVTGKTVTVYGIRPSDKATVVEKSEGEWVGLTDYLNRVRDEAGVKLKATAQKALQYQNVQNRYDLNKLERLKFAEDSKFGNFLKNLKEARQANENEKVQNYLKLYRATGGEEFTDADALSNEQDAVYATYPMLQYLNWYDSGDEFKRTVGDYIRDVDARAGK